MFGNVYDPDAALARAATLLRPGGRVVVSHPMGRDWHARLRRQNPEMVPRDLPDPAEAERLFTRAGLRLVTALDEADVYAMIGASAT
jgi:hypothetical protein